MNVCKPFLIGLVPLVVCFHLQLKAQENVANSHTPLSEPTQLLNNTPKTITAPKPPMGWNSWDNFGLDITEDEFKQQVDYVAEHLKKYGYEYMVIDAGWYAPQLSAKKESVFYEGNLTKFETLVDGFGRWIAAVNKFPSAKDSGFNSLAAYVHSKGLKFGLHIQRGIPWSAIDKNLPVKGTTYHAKDIANPADVCTWWDATLGVDMSKPGAQEYYNSCYELYASWGVDFVKVDDISRPYHADEITAIRKAIERCSRPMVFSLSPGSTPISARYHAQNNADMWRISDDFWDTWPQLKNQFQLADNWMRFKTEGHWPDLDMLPVGIVGTRSGDAGGARRSRFTLDELRTLMTLWCMFRSPLILGGDLTKLNNEETKLITNVQLIDIDQNSTNCKRLAGDNNYVIYSATAKAHKTFVALFNLSDIKRKISFSLKKLGISNNVDFLDVWNNKRQRFDKELTSTVPPHGAALFLYSAE